MKPSIKILSAIGCAYAITAASSFAQVYTFDEYGNSTGPGISPGVLLAAYPSGGTAGPVLVYTLPFPTVTGDVVLTEPGSATGQQDSDIVRFWNPTGGNNTQVIFYSDFSTAANDPPDSPADTGLPTSLINPILIPEVGPEGNNGASYTPPAGGPGSAPVAVQYNIISDGRVPEPGTLALATLGGGLLLVSLKRRHQTNG